VPSELRRSSHGRDGLRRTQTAAFPKASRYREGLRREGTFDNAAGRALADELLTCSSINTHMRTMAFSSRTLAELEGAVFRASESHFQQRASLLYELRASESLWRAEGFASFMAYCEGRKRVLGFANFASIWRYVSAWEIVLELGRVARERGEPDTRMPWAEKQCRELRACCHDEGDDLFDVWVLALASTDADNLPDGPSITSTCAAIRQANDSNVFMSSKTDEHYTPPWLVALVLAVLGGIDLDPA